MENICGVCKGEGLVGVGENPHLKEGNISTCSACAGTGKLVSSEITASTLVDSIGEVSASVTNPEVEPKKNAELEPESVSSSIQE